MMSPHPPRILVLATRPDIVQAVEEAAARMDPKPRVRRLFGRRMTVRESDLILVDIAEPRATMTYLRQMFGSAPALVALIEGTWIDRLESALAEDWNDYLFYPLNADELGLVWRRHTSATEPPELNMDVDDTGRIRVAFPSRVRYQQPVVDRVVVACRHLADLDAGTAFRLRVALGEAVANAILYGSGGRAGAVVRVTAAAQRDGGMQVSVADEGEGFDPESVPDPVADDVVDRTRGRGLFLLRQLSDQVKFNDVGNEVTLVFRRVIDPLGMVEPLLSRFAEVTGLKFRLDRLSEDGSRVLFDSWTGAGGTEAAGGTAAAGGAAGAGAAEAGGAAATGGTGAAHGAWAAGRAAAEGRAVETWPLGGGDSLRLVSDDAGGADEQPAAGTDLRDAVSGDEQAGAQRRAAPGGSEAWPSRLRPSWEDRPLEDPAALLSGWLSAVAEGEFARERRTKRRLRRVRVLAELEVARDLQLRLLPPPDDFRDLARVAARCDPALSLGGDFYYLARLPGGRLGVMLGDVSSHGPSAALIMARTLSAVAVATGVEAEPAAALDAMQGQLRAALESTEMYMTLFYGVMDPGAGEVAYANAGHPYAYCLRPGEARRLVALDPPVGIAQVTRYQQKKVACGGETLLAFTDGLAELSDPVSSPSSGVGKLIEAGNLHPDDLVAALFGDSDGEMRLDDRTAVAACVP